jgi:hypothetical protein
VRGRLAARAIERAAQELPVDCHNTLNSLGKSRHEPLEGNAKLRRIEQPEQPAEGIVAGQTVRELEKAA